MKDNPLMQRLSGAPLQKAQKGARNNGAIGSQSRTKVHKDMTLSAPVFHSTTDARSHLVDEPTSTNLVRTRGSTLHGYDNGVLGNGKFRRNVMGILHFVRNSDDLQNAALAATPGMKRTENELSLDSSTSRVIHSASRKSVARGRRDLMDSVGAPPVGGASASGSVMKGSMQSHRDSLTSQNCREENFDSILGHIVKGYRQINPKGCNPCRGHDTFERASGVTCLVNHAVDSCVPRETSASLTDSYSNLSVLTSNCDHYFEKRLSFNTRSEFTDVEDESEINLKTNVLMGLATFDEKNAEVSVSVSCPIKMIALPFTFSGTAKAPEMPKGTAISASRTLASFSMTLSSSLLQAGDVEWDEAHGGADSDVTLKSAVELLSISSGCDCLRMNYTGSSLSTTCGDLVAAMK